MNIVGVQLIVSAFGFLMLYNLFLHWKKNDIGIKGAMAWIILWGGLVWITLFPKSIESFIKDLFFIRIFDFATVAALIVLSYVMFENHIRINKLKRQMEILVRIISLRK